MDRVERLQAALAGEPVDRPPFSFWYHFGLQHMPGEAVAAAHIAFARRFQPDFLKVMGDYPYPAPELLSVDRPSDWSSLEVLHGKEGGWGQQLEALHATVKAMRGRTWVVDTVYSPWTILCRLGTRDLAVRTAREHPGFLKHALKAVATSQANYVRHALATGIQGIYFAVTEARYDRLSPAEYHEWCRPYDLEVLEAAAGAPFNTLHIHGRKTYFDELKDYPVAAVTWSHFHTGPGIARGLAAWTRAVLGGLDEVELHRQTPGSIRAFFEQHAEEFWLPRLILAPGCSLRPDISPNLLDAVRNGVERLRRLRPKEPLSAEQYLARQGPEERLAEVEEPRPRAGRRSGPVEGERRPGPAPGEPPARRPAAPPPLPGEPPVRRPTRPPREPMRPRPAPRPPAPKARPAEQGPPPKRLRIPRKKPGGPPPEEG